MSDEKVLWSDDSRVQSACVLLMAPGSSLVLLEPRTDGVFGLPGGKRELGERSYECAKRELREETGFEMHLGTLILLAPAGPHLCACFFADRWSPPQSASLPRAWANAEDLIAESARFPEFYRRMFVALACKYREGVIQPGVSR